jgi:hypothetical protein
MPEPAVDIRPFRSGDGDGLRALWTDAGFRLVGDDDPGLERFAERNAGLFLVAVERESDTGLAFWRAQGYEPRETVHLGNRL